MISALLTLSLSIVQRSRRRKAMARYYQLHERDGITDPHVSTHATGRAAKKAARKLVDWQIWEMEESHADELPTCIRFCQSIDGGEWQSAQ